LEDSLWIWSYQRKVYVEPQSKKKCKEVFVYNYSSTLSGNWNINCNLVSPYVEQFIFNIYYANTDNGGTIVRFEYTEGAFISPTQPDGDVTKIDSVEVNSIIYKDILFLNYPNLTNTVEIYQQAYYTPDIGLVRYKKRDGEVWNLIDYEIKQ